MATNTTENIQDRNKGMSTKEIDDQVKKLAAELQKGKKKKLFLPEGAGIQNPLPVGINGVMFALPVGEEIEIPEAVYDIVMNQSNVLRKNYGQTPEAQATKGKKQ